MSVEFSLAITTYNRADRLIPFVKKYETYSDLKEILIMDDCSNDWTAFNNEKWSNKVIIQKNGVNIGAYKNKLNVLSKTSGEWIILFDSDNFFEASFLEVLKGQSPLDEDVIYCPSKAAPFDYSNLSNLTIDKSNWNEICKREQCFVNTGNMCLSRKAVNFLLENIKTDPVQQPFVECKYMNYLFIKNGFKLKVVEGLEYQHAISHDSFYLSHQSQHVHFDSMFNWTL